MAWGDLTDNQMVSFTDAQTSGFLLNSGQSHVTSSQCMTKADVLTKYTVESSALSSYNSNQLLPKNLWVNNLFLPLNQTSRQWTGITANRNGDVYACVVYGDIYKQTGGTGDFVALGQTSRSWQGIAAAPNGDVYACVNAGDIYKQTGGTGDFVALGETTRGWDSMAASISGNIYAGAGYIVYKQANGIGTFTQTGQPFPWGASPYTIAAAINKDIYVGTLGDIYKQTNETGDFVALGQATRTWLGMTGAPNGDVYACVPQGGIYKQIEGVGDFVSLGQSPRAWQAMAAPINGSGIYACVYQGDIYKLTVGFSFGTVGSTTSSGVCGLGSKGLTLYSADTILQVGSKLWYDSGLTNRFAIGESDQVWIHGGTRSYRIQDFPITNVYDPQIAEIVECVTCRSYRFTASRDGSISWTSCAGTPSSQSTSRFSTYTICAQEGTQTGSGGSWTYLGECNPSTIYYNTQQSATAARNDCPEGYTGSDVTLTVAANTYSSPISVAIANQLALDYIYDNLQDYANANGTCTAVYYNTQQSGTATRDNCSEGYTGSTETLIVQAGTYTSSISVQNANDLAIAYIDINAQNYANANGTCTAIPVYYNTQQSTTATRNNCSEGYTGSTETLIAQAGTFTSTIGVQDANNKAIAYLDLNAQNYANTNGTCTAPTGNILFNGYTPALTDMADDPFIFNQNITVDTIVDSDKAFFTIPSTGTYAITLTDIGGGTKRYQIIDMYGSYSRTETFNYGLLVVNGVVYSDMISGYLELTLNADDVIFFIYPSPNLGNGEDGIPDFYGNYQFQLIIEELS